VSLTVEVVCATSLDGKISTPDRRPWRWSDPEDHEWLLSRMAEADLLVTGAGTIRAEDPTVILPEPWAARRAERGKSPQPVRLVLSPSLSVPPDCRAARVEGAKLLIASRRESIEARGAAFAGRAELIPWGDDLRLTPLLEAARRRAEGDRIVCLGGGRTNAAFLEEDLVDRISLTVASFVIGARGAPGPFDGGGFDGGNFPQFRVIEERRAGRDRILVYERDRDAAPRRPATGLD
jgi:5-amino-6-(5-phosphoribosylamino)uracil reductase